MRFLKNQSCYIVNDSQNNAEFPLSSQELGTLYFDFNKILDKIDNCCTETVELVNAKTCELKVYPVCCDNRACDNEACQDHRLYKYMRYHKKQIRVLDKSMKKPKAWVFTDGHLNFPIDKRYCQDRLKFLFKLLNDKKHGSVTEFSIHMEFKIHPELNTAYLHFHVICGAVRDLAFIRYRWDRQVKKQVAIKPKNLSFYVSKYASKTPHFVNEGFRYLYLMAVYKLQMHRFSVGHAEFEPSGWYRVEDLVLELKRSLAHDYYWTREGTLKCKDYHEYLDRPPPAENFIMDSDLLACEPILDKSLSICHISEYMPRRSLKAKDSDVEAWYKENDLIE